MGTGKPEGGDEAMPVLESLRYARGSLQVLDQLKLPHTKEYVEVADSKAAWTVVQKMQVRGAPLIAIVSALGLAVEASLRRQDATIAEAAAWLRESMTYLRTSRPTAVNLANAMDELESVVDKAHDTARSAAEVYDAYIRAAEGMLAEDVAANKPLGSTARTQFSRIWKRRVGVVVVHEFSQSATRVPWQLRVGARRLASS